MKLFFPFSNISHILFVNMKCWQCHFQALDNVPLIEKMKPMFKYPPEH